MFALEGSRFPPKLPRLSLWSRLQRKKASLRWETRQSARTVHFALKQGTRVRILDTREGWLQIARCDGRRGWIPKAAVAEL